MIIIVFLIKAIACFTLIIVIDCFTVNMNDRLLSKSKYQIRIRRDSALRSTVESNTEFSYIDGLKVMKVKVPVLTEALGKEMFYYEISG